MKTDCDLEKVALPNGVVRYTEDASTDGGRQILRYAGTGQAYAIVAHASPAQLEETVSKAKTAFASAVWSGKLASERSRIMQRIADVIDAHSEELIQLHTLETGIPAKQARAMHVPRSAENFRFFGELLGSLSGETYDQTGRYLSLVTREPVGVGLVIAPWNAPLILSTMKIAAAMSVGNSVILKPSEYTPLCALRLVELMAEAGVPENVVQVVCGPGQSVGKELVQHSDIGAVGFIGGTATGKSIMAGAAINLKKVGLELGGKSANIITPSADLDAAVDGSLMAIFANNGEQCLAGSRILVDEAIADQFIAQFVERVSAIRVGDPFDEQAEIGPLAFAAHFDRVCDFARQAHDSDTVTVLAGGVPLEDRAGGYYFAPTVVETNDNKSPLCQEEIFGPFVTIQRTRNIEDAITRANDSDFGLVAYIWAQDIDEIMQARKRIEAGTIWVNTPMARDVRAPFGGYKQSGIGRDGLPGSIELYTEEKTTMIPQEKLSIPKLGMPN